MQGTCIWFSNSKGYGFVQDKATGNEYFCHFSAIQGTGYKSLKQDAKVLFEIEKGPKGRPQASKVQVVD